MIRGVVDRIEDGIAVVLLEPRGRAYLAAEDLPPGAAPGTIIRLTLQIEGGLGTAESAAVIDRLRRGDHLR